MISTQGLVDKIIIVKCITRSYADILHASIDLEQMLREELTKKILELDFSDDHLLIYRGLLPSQVPSKSPDADYAFIRPVGGYNLFLKFTS